MAIPFYKQKKTASGSYVDFKIIDAGIMNGFETLTKLGGYIMIFSMISSLISKLPLDEIPMAMVIASIEVTGGINCIAKAALSHKMKYVMSVICITFGGISGIAQTSAMLTETDMPILSYIKGKLIITALAGTAAYITINLV
jgi:hypothetical protein